MEASDGSPPASLCVVRAAELFPKPPMELEDPQLKVPFQELAGESVKYLGRTDDGVLALTNYRLFMKQTSTGVETSIPMGLIESTVVKELFHLIIFCKDASTAKCSFETTEQCTEWNNRLKVLVGLPEPLERIFAFPFCAWACDTLSSTENGQGAVQACNSNGGEPESNPSSYSAMEYAERLQKSTSRYEDDFMREVERLGFDLKGSWRISHANEDFKLCPSYPPKLLVPCCISDETLHTVATFRGSRRLPAVVWRHRKSGATIARCSQPEVGWLGWRNTKDEQLLKALADACAFDRGEQMRQLAANAEQAARSVPAQSGDSSPSSPDSSHEEVAMDEVRKMLIVDARSYTSAVTNRARGGGCECIDYYPSAEIEFMNLGNIHVIRKSFQALRALCGSPPDVPNWLGLLEKTMWLQHLSGLMAASMTVCHAIETKGRPVLVHCSDGWDRTPQIVATAQLCLDPYYRTVEGFRVLVEREWLSYGHKFADRLGHGPCSEDTNERCPVFVQWLDIVHQIHKQFSCSFEFSMGYLIKLAQHSHSGLFGNFLCNTLKERLENAVFERTFSVWAFLNGPMYRNPLYKPQKDKVLWPAHNVRDLSLWTEVYLGSLGGTQGALDFPAYVSESLAGSISSMSKTRSYGDLITAGIIQNSMSRRSSDPNMTVDPNLTIASNSENNSIADLQSDGREESPDSLANLIHDTTKKLENLTNELNNHDTDDDFKMLNKSLPSSETLVAKSSGEEPVLLMENENINGGDKQMLDDDNDKKAASCDQVKMTTTSKVNGTMRIETQENAKAEISNGKKQDLLDALGLILNGYRDIGNGDTAETAETDVKKDGGIERTFNGITVETHTDLNLDLMKSVMVLDGPLSPVCGSETSCSGPSASANSASVKSDDLLQGSLNASTDTLVPANEIKVQNGSSCDTTDSVVRDTSPLPPPANIVPMLADISKVTKISTNCNILPKVHSTTSSTSSLAATPPRPTQLSTTTNNSSNNVNHNSTATSTQTSATSAVGSDHDKTSSNDAAHSDNKSSLAALACGMDESILILPEHRKLEISISGKCETVAASTNATSSSASNAGTTTTPQRPQSMATALTPTPNSNTTTAASSQRKRRTSSSNSKREAFTARHVNGSYMSRFSLPGGGARSLPMTPPGLTERQQVTISCPDGLAHALSEENIRLQQIVLEHKMREDALLRELHDMRMALLKKICPNCNTANPAATNDEQCAGLDNVESSSICSWEDVENRSNSGPSSSTTTTTSSSTQPNASSVLWVPDHAVSRCTTCETEFWLGRRKHHCRSCGQIFCADCSEFWAPLPDAKLFSPVRLCGPCYLSVTTRMQQVNSKTNNNSSSCSSSTTATTTTSSQMAASSTLMHLQQAAAAKTAATSKA